MIAGTGVMKKIVLIKKSITQLAMPTNFGVVMDDAYRTVS